MEIYEINTFYSSTFPPIQHKTRTLQTSSILTDLLKDAELKKYEIQEVEESLKKINSAKISTTRLLKLDEFINSKSDNLSYLKNQKLQIKNDLSKTAKDSLVKLREQFETQKSPRAKNSEKSLQLKLKAIDFEIDCCLNEKNRLEQEKRNLLVQFDANQKTISIFNQITAKLDTLKKEYTSLLTKVQNIQSKEEKTVENDPLLKFKSFVLENRERWIRDYSNNLIPPVILNSLKNEASGLLKKFSEGFVVEVVNDSRLSEIMELIFGYISKEYRP